jgi:hypothetical protein
MPESAFKKILGARRANATHSLLSFDKRCAEP